MYLSKSSRQIEEKALVHYLQLKIDNSTLKILKYYEVAAWKPKIVCFFSFLKKSTSNKLNFICVLIHI